MPVAVRGAGAGKGLATRARFGGGAATDDGDRFAGARPGATVVRQTGG